MPRSAFLKAFVSRPAVGRDFCYPVIEHLLNEAGSSILQCVSNVSAKEELISSLPGHRCQINLTTYSADVSDIFSYTDVTKRR